MLILSRSRENMNNAFGFMHQLSVVGPGQLAQFPTRPKTNSPNFGQLAQKPTRPITNSPKFGQLAQFFQNLFGQLAQNHWSTRPIFLPTRPNFDHICFVCFEKKVYC